MKVFGGEGFLGKETDDEDKLQAPYPKELFYWLKSLDLKFLLTSQSPLGSLGLKLRPKSQVETLNQQLRAVVRTMLAPNLPWAT